MRQMSPDHQDARTRIHIDANRDGQSARWKLHPAVLGTPAATPGAALDAAIAELGIDEAVIILNGRPPP
jgi:hypothetical protein